MNKKKIRQTLLITGLSLLLIGALISLFAKTEWSDYLLIVGAALIICRGFIKI